MAAALYDRSRRYDGQSGLLLQLFNGEAAAVAHGGFDLVQSTLHAVGQGSRVRNVAVYTFLKAEFCRAAQVISLPVAGTVGTFTPVLLYIVAVDQETSNLAKYLPSMTKSAPMARARVI